MGTDTLTRFAAIDIGSNAVRLLLCNVVEEDGVIHFNKSELIRMPIRLGEDVFKSGWISDHKAERLVNTLKAYKLLIDVFQPVAFRACATASLREAKNGQKLIERIKRATSLHVDLVSGKEEAELIYSNHVEEKLDKHSDYAYIDVGGGSTEISFFSKGICKASRSFPIGTLRLLYGHVSPETWEEMKEWVRKKSEKLNIKSAIGSGGNINKIHKLIGRKDKALSFVLLKVFYREMKSLSVDDRIDIWELSPDRADVIVPAARIFLSIMKAGRIPEVLVPQVGLSDGIIHHLYEHRKGVKHRKGISKSVRIPKNLA